MLEEKLRATLSSVLADYSNQGMSIGSIYYTFKDVFKDFETSYNTYIQQEIQKLEQESNESTKPQQEETLPVSS